MTFNPSKPAPNDLLSDSQLDIQTNFSTSNTSFGLNHYSFDNLTVKNGKHKFVEMPNSALPVGLAATEGTLYTKTAAAASELYYTRDASGIEIQMTGPDKPVATTNGHTFLPGGILMQWGQITSTNSSFTPLLFATANIDFPNNCFDVFTQPFGSGNVPGGACTIEVRKSTISKTKFDWVMVTNSGEYTGFFWWAIGN